MRLSRSCVMEGSGRWQERRPPAAIVSAILPSARSLRRRRRRSPAGSGRSRRAGGRRRAGPSPSPRVDDDDRRAGARGDRHHARRPDRPAASSPPRAAGRTRRAARIARSITSGTSACPNEIVSLFRMPPHVRHGGSSSPARTRSSASCIGAFAPQRQADDAPQVPWTSTTCSGECRRAGAARRCSA